uniref:DUF29 domain-containing protein n=1 Tax=Petrachloros mirabilis TaxID=2918835 RepID=UPI001EE7B648|nr:DUF29 domain-containing protein [Petrachloros mirabilis]
MGNDKIGHGSAVTPMETTTLYDQDFYAWTQRQYEKALSLVDRETPIDPSRLPQSCPFSEAKIFEEPVDL